MELALILTVFSACFLALWAASLLWKHCTSSLYGYIPVLSMVIIGIIMMMVFQVYRPNFLSLKQYILALYGCCVLYFTLQLCVVYILVNKFRSKVSS